MRPLILTLSLLLPLALALLPQEDDMVFDDVGDETATPATHSHEDHRGRPRDYERFGGDKKYNVERLWGIPDAAVVVAHTFKMKIPKQAFSGNVDHYEVRGTNMRSLPHWLHWDEPASTLTGVPSKRDIGHHHVNVKAFGKRGDVAKAVFTIDVITEGHDGVPHKDKKTRCDENEDPTILTLALATRFESLKPSDKVNAIENLAGFLGLHTSAFTIHPHAGKETSVSDGSVILSGPGNVRHRKEKHTTAIQWQVGCDGHLWHHQIDLVKQLRDQAKDGTLAEVLQQPVLSWNVKTYSSLLLRNRRDAGSGDYEYDDEYNYDDDEYDDDQDGENGDDNEAITELPPVGVDKSDVDGDFRVQSPYDPGHPHRHHHGEETIDPTIEEVDVEDIVPRLAHELGNRLLTSTLAPPINTTQSPTTTQQPATTSTTTPTTTTTTTTPAATTTTSPPTTTTTIVTMTPDNVTTTTTMAPPTEPQRPETTEEPEERNRQNEIELETIVPTTIPEPSSTTPSTTTTTTTFTPTPTAPTEKPTTKPIVVIVHSTTTVEPTTSETTPIPIPSTTSTPAPTTTTTRPTTPVIFTTEKIEEEVKNFEPHLDKPLKKSAVTAGKQFNFIIPRETFSDMEDGDTRSLELNVYFEGKKLESTHWLQFNKTTQKVYGLPLKTDISAYVYEVVASDSEGLTSLAELDVTVQQHRLDHTFNHEFSIDLLVNNKFPSYVDWALKVIQSLNELYGDRNPNQTKITVQSVVRIGSMSNKYTFTWSNDSVPRGAECPKEQIEQLLEVLELDKYGNPSEELVNILGPDIQVSRVAYRGKGQCEEPVTQEPKHINSFPIPRNQVDHVNATVGQLLVFDVPPDSFYDAEDGPANKMKMSLLLANRTAIPQDHWLQFENNNKEFFGVPAEEDIGRKEYQLVVTDKEGANATDVLVVVVHPAPQVTHSTEFSMTLVHPYETFAHSATKKRKFIENLKDVFGDNTTGTIRLNSITNSSGIANGSIIVSWYNTTLPTSYCPKEKVEWIQKILVTDGKSVTERMGFSVDQTKLTPMGQCLGDKTITHNETHETPINGDTDPLGKHDDDYLITFVLPAIIISLMLILAAIIAWVLFRRRRSGKMSVSEQDDERQSFRNKGIPVIFQDELDEKPDPGNKSPVILKEEKPPLPPPEYQKTEDGADVPMLQKENSEEPYQPPPPFATNRDNNRQNRPKPTPTYRKPPPYVPP